MAEYIDKSKITKAIPAEEDNCTGMGMTLDEMDAYNYGIDVMYDLVMRTPKADVVERSKVDKAIEEIKNAKMYRGNTKGLPNDIGLDRYFDKGLMKAIEILKRNLGE